MDRSTDLVRTMYGHDALHTGRFELTDPALMSRARAVLPDRERPSRTHG
ncbi:hypothetical protein AB0P17_30755 [Streptomyces sp. NPDC088124]